MTQDTNTHQLPDTLKSPLTDSTGPEKKSPTIKKSKEEFGGREGPEPTRYGDWENNGIISDF